MSKSLLLTKKVEKLSVITKFFKIFKHSVLYGIFGILGLFISVASYADPILVLQPGNIPANIVEGGDLISFKFAAANLIGPNDATDIDIKITIPPTWVYVDIEANSHSLGNLTVSLIPTGVVNEYQLSPSSLVLRAGESIQFDLKLRPLCGVLNTAILYNASYKDGGMSSELAQASSGTLTSVIYADFITQFNPIPTNPTMLNPYEKTVREWNIQPNSSDSRYYARSFKVKMNCDSDNINVEEFICSIGTSEANILPVKTVDGYEMIIKSSDIVNMGIANGRLANGQTLNIKEVIYSIACESQFPITYELFYGDDQTDKWCSHTNLSLSSNSIGIIEPSFDGSVNYNNTYLNVNELVSREWSIGPIANATPGNTNFYLDGFKILIKCDTDKIGVREIIYNNSPVVYFQVTGGYEFVIEERLINGQTIDIEEKLYFKDNNCTGGIENISYDIYYIYENDLGVIECNKNIVNNALLPISTIELIDAAFNLYNGFSNVIVNVNEEITRNWDVTLDAASNDFYIDGFNIFINCNTDYIKFNQIKFSNGGNILTFTANDISLVNSSDPTAGYKITITPNNLNTLTGRTDGKLVQSDAITVYVEENLYYAKCNSEGAANISYTLEYGYRDNINNINNIVKTCTDASFVLPASTVTPYTPSFTVSQITPNPLMVNTYESETRTWSVKPSLAGFYIEGMKIEMTIDPNVNLEKIEYFNGSDFTEITFTGNSYIIDGPIISVITGGSTKLTSLDELIIRETLSYNDCSGNGSIDYVLSYGIPSNIPELWCTSSSLILNTATISVIASDFVMTGDAPVNVTVNHRDLITRDWSVTPDETDFYITGLKVQAICNRNLISFDKIELNLGLNSYTIDNTNIVWNSVNNCYEFIVDSVIFENLGCVDGKLLSNQKLNVTEKLYYIDCSGTETINYNLSFGNENGWCTDATLSLGSLTMDTYNSGFNVNSPQNIIINGYNAQGSRDWSVEVNSADPGFHVNGLKVKIACSVNDVKFDRNVIKYTVNNTGAVKEIPVSIISGNLGYEIIITPDNIFDITGNYELHNGDELKFSETIVYTSCVSDVDMDYSIYYGDGINWSDSDMCDNGFVNPYRNTITNAAIDVQFTNINARSIYKNNTEESVIITGKLKNLSNIYDLPYAKLELFFNNDGSGLINSNNLPAVSDFLYVQDIPANTEKEFVWVVDINALDVCKLMLAVRMVNNVGICVDEIYPISNIDYQINDAELTVCQGEEIAIGEPNVLAYTYSWIGLNSQSLISYLDRTDISQPNFIYPTTINSVKTLEYQLTTNRPGGCSSPSVSTVTINVNPVPSVSAIYDFTLCSGENFNLFTFSGSVAGAKYIWSRIGSSDYFGLNDNNGVNTIPSFTAVNNSTSVITATFSVTPVFVDVNNNECMGDPETFEIIVYPSPVINHIDDYTYCHGESVSPIVFSGNISNAEFTWEHTGGANIGLTGDGFGSMPAFTASNLLTSPVTAEYTITMNYGINGFNCIDTETFEITVNPVPVVLNVEDRSLCSGENLVINFAGNVTGAEYIWEKVSGSSISGLDAQGNGNIDVIVTNATTQAISSRYKVTPVYGLCEGISQEFEIIVYPSPIINHIDDYTYCHGESVPSVIFSGNVSNAEFTWEHTGGANIGLTGDGFGSMPAFTASNSLISPVTAEYTITMNYGINGFNCIDTETFEITVNPVPVVLNVEDQSLCSGENLVVNFAGNATGAEYVWEKVNGSSISGLDAQGNGNIDVIITNTTTQAISSRYKVTPVYGLCEGISQEFSIKVYPQPILNNLPEVDYCHGDIVPPYYFSGNIADAEYTWELISGTNVGLTENGFGNMPSFTATNYDVTTLQTAVYSVTMSYGIDGLVCSDNKVLKISVYPVPTLEHIEDQYICSGGDLTLDFTGITNSTVYWEKTAGNTIPGLPSSGTNNMDFVVNNTTMNQLSATYRLTPKIGNCTGLSQEINIVVFPSPALTSSTSTVEICSGESFVYNASSNIDGTVFSWVSKDEDNNIISTGNSGNINEILTNTGINPISITYTISLIQNSFCEVTEDIKVRVNPVPQIDLKYLNYVCWNAEVVYIPYSSPDNTSYEYIITFDDMSLDAGFVNVGSYQTLQGDKLRVELPNIPVPGTYHGVVTIKTYTCSMNHPIAIQINNPIYIEKQPVSIVGACENNFDIDLEVIASGDSLVYQWFYNGASILGATENTYVTEYFEGMDGEYFVEISNRCEVVRSDVITVTPSDITIGLKWDDVLYIDNTKGPFVSWQWYKNGSPLADNANLQYYTDKNGLNGTYHVVCYYVDGTSAESCPKTFVSTEIRGIDVYPNPVEVSSNIFIDLDNNENIDNARYEIYDALGRMVDNRKITNFRTEIKSPAQAGSYLVKIFTSSNSRGVIKHMIVK